MLWEPLFFNFKKQTQLAVLTLFLLTSLSLASPKEACKVILHSKLTCRAVSNLGNFEVQCQYSMNEAIPYSSSIKYSYEFTCKGSHLASGEQTGYLKPQKQSGALPKAFTEVYDLDYATGCSSSATCCSPQKSQVKVKIKEVTLFADNGVTCSL
jgi:hypothetical protein